MGYITRLLSFTVWFLEEQKHFVNIFVHRRLNKSNRLTQDDATSKTRVDEFKKRNWNWSFFFLIVNWLLPSSPFLLSFLESSSRFVSHHTTRLFTYLRGDERKEEDNEMKVRVSSNPNRLCVCKCVCACVSACVKTKTSGGAISSLCSSYCLLAACMRAWSERSPIGRWVE